MNYINKISLVLVLCLAGSFCLAGCKEAEIPSAYQTYATTDHYNNLSTESDDVTLHMMARDLCVGGIDNTESEAIDQTLAETAAVFMVDDQNITFSKNIYEQRSPASTTKIMTAMIALKYGNLDDEIIVNEAALADLEKGSSVCGLKAGDKITLDQALYGLMLCSGNDAANVIAEHISGSNHEFAKLMNEEAASLGCTGTHFVNPHGLTDPEHYTTAYDLYLIFNKALENEDFCRYISAKTFKAEYSGLEGAVEQEWENTNGYFTGEYQVPDGITVIGGKTGTTLSAGSCLVLYSKNSSGAPVISIVMRGNNHDDLYELMSQLLVNFSN